MTVPPFRWAAETHPGGPQRIKGLKVQAHIPSDLLTEVGPAPPVGGYLFPLWLISEGAYNLPLATQTLTSLLSRNSGFYTLNPLPHKTVLCCSPKERPRGNTQALPSPPPAPGVKARLSSGEKASVLSRRSDSGRIVNGPRERLSREEERSETAAEGTRSSEWEVAPGRRGARRVRGYAPRKPRHPLVPRGKDGRRDQGPDPDARARPTWGCWVKLPSTAGSPAHTNTLAGPRTHLTQKPY